MAAAPPTNIAAIPTLRRRFSLKGKRRRAAATAATHRSALGRLRVRRPAAAPAASPHLRGNAAPPDADRPPTGAVGSGRSPPLHLQRSSLFPFSDRHRQQVQEKGGQERVQRGLQDHDLVERHDARERVKDSRRQRSRIPEEPPRREEDESDRGRAEEDLDDACRGEARAARREEVRVERAHEVRHGALAPKEQVPVRDARGEARVDPAVDVAVGLEERMRPEPRENGRLGGERRRHEEEKPPRHPARLPPAPC